MPVSDLTVKVWPELGQAALRLRLDKELRLWTLAKALDPQGEGRIKIAQLSTTKIKGTSPQHIRRIIKSGEGTFWRRGGGWLYLVGVLTLCKSLGVEYVSRSRSVLMPRSLRDFRASLAYCPNSPNPVAKETIGRKIKRTETTVQNYRRAAGTRLNVRRQYKDRGTRREQMPNIYRLDCSLGRREKVLNRALRHSPVMVARDHARRRPSQQG